VQAHQIVPAFFEALLAQAKGETAILLIAQAGPGLGFELVAEAPPKHDA
jgi:hypothetical protein